MGRAPLARPTDAPSIVHRAEDDAGRGRGDRGDAAAAEEAPATERERGVEAGAIDTLARDDLPRHIAIIMDGNRRWARQRGLPDLDGHRAGVEAIRTLVRHVVHRGVPILSLYAFSRENWARSDAEVAGLFELLEQAIHDETDELSREGVRVRLLGRTEELPAETRESIEWALDATGHGQRLLLNIAFNYAGRTELVDAVRALVRSGRSADEIDEAAIAGSLYTAGLPDPDLVIRTGGEQRLSNFLIWQAAYAELYMSPLLWPDFDAAAFDAAVLEYARRTRRFGR